ncbi:transcription factor 20 [Phycodurus eques]|uniref:transcription factor 20 n=1 Tax=Phycodurus eques TaxID=693459 RepID=UPI002ACDFCC2|nr:transcription factor 20 [Phycodurus eques]XP_061556403.1 transcription factor 20 [Phycodurus eques]XP_061556404.1 transcription factor 20 [Phycodurus eques]
MQNFSKSPTPHSLPPGFSMRGGSGPPYLPQPADPQVSPRMTEDYAAMQQQSLHRGHPHSNQASPMLAYNARNRGIVEPPPTQGNLHSSSNNPYRKDTMDYYFSLCGKDKNRRGGLVYGTGFAYPNIDGHIPPQYRHSSSASVLSSGIMSQYSVDYGPSTGSGGGSGAFSPHQYNMGHNAAMQAMPASQSRQHGQTFSPVQHGQQHRSYPTSGHRMTPQYPQYSPQAGASTGSSGMYSPPPQRYIDGTTNTGFDPKVNSSHSVNSTANSASASAAANNMGPVESVQQRYHASNYAGYIPQTQTLQKEGTLQHCNTQHNLSVGYDNPLKIHHQGPTPGSVYGKHHQASTSSIPHVTSREIAKSPMHPQQSQMNQNLSPISNPSPAASAVHSPSCSSTPSPLMGVSETYVNPSGPSHPPSTVHSSSHSHRLIQAVSQLSPTPNSNSSISSCGSTGSHKGHNVSTIGVNSVPPTSCNKTGLGSGFVPREEGPSVYSAPAVGKMLDAGLNSLNALSSQVANLPNTIQHMLRTDNVLSQKKSKDGGQMQQATHGVPPLQPRSRNASAASSTGTVKDGTVVGVAEGAGLETVADEDSSFLSSETKMEQEDHLIDGGHTRVRQMSGASSGSEPIFYHAPQSQPQPQPGQVLHAKTFTYKSPPKEIVSKANVHIASTLKSPSSECRSSEADPNSHSKPPVSSSTHCIVPQPNRVSHPSFFNNNSKGGHKKSAEIKNEQIKTELEDGVEKMEKGNSQMLQDGEISTKHGQDKENMLHTASTAHDESEQKPTTEEQLSVGVIVSARSEGSQVEKSKQPQDLCLKEKQSQSYLKESMSHNGEEGIDLSRYPSQHPKSNLEQAHNLNQFGSHKYGFIESTYGSDLSLMKKGRTGPAGGLESSSRNYQQSHSGYGPTHSKELSSLAEAFGKRGQAIGTKGQEDISQIQQFPSLLQEVLQGYNLDRRYGRPEQAFPAHLQVQQQFQTRYPYGMTENMRMVEGGASDTLAQMGTIGKPQHQNHRLGSKTNFGTGPQSSMKPEVFNSKILQNTAKKEVDFSEDHLPRASNTQPLQPKHINLADYSLPQRKTLNVSTSSSAVQELLLQELEPLKGCTGQAESQKSERRSVICDVSPNRRSTPERDRESNREREKNQSVASVIQQPFSSPASANDLNKKDILEKKVVKIETASKEIGPNPDFHGSGGTNETDMEYSSKSARSSIVLNSDHYRHLPPNSLSSPSRHQSYLYGVDIVTSNANSFPGYRFGETRESNMPRGHPHFPSHHPYHNLSPQAQTTNKLQMYPHPRGPFQHSHEINDWVKAMNRPAKDKMMIPVSSPGRHKVSQSEHRQRMIPQTDMHSDQHGSKTLLHQQGLYYDMKMWETTPPGRDGVRIFEGDSCYRTQGLPPPSAVTAGSQGILAPPKAHGSNTAEHEETKRPCLPPPCNSTKPQTDVTSTQPQVQRQTKSGGPGETNPLILRRRVRSFISPIPAKRLLQDASQQRAATNSHAPGAHSESNHHKEDEPSSSNIPCLSSPLPGDNTFPKSLSPSSGNTKALAPKKGRGLKLEAIVQKISPSITKPAGSGDDGTNHYPGFSNATTPLFSDSQDQDITHFPRVVGGDDCYIEDSHSLNDMMPFRGVDETGPLPLSAYPCDTQTRKQKDFDFGLGAAVVSASGDKEDFALLGPLPPPPPLPRPVQGSPPPSSSALSDIQHFTNTYQELETRRGEQSAANLLQQKLQESGMGFDDYPGSDYYRTTSPHHSQSQGHVLSRHQMSSPRPNLSLQDCKTSDNNVPKGYFPSGKKKGRPVGSVNKQKRAQNPIQTQIQSQAQPQNTNQNYSQLPPTPITTAPTIPDTVQTTTSTDDSILESKSTPPLTPPILTQVVKVDVESEPMQPEVEVKPVRRRRKGLKDEDGSPERRGRQRMRRGGAPASQSTARDSPETLLGAKGANGTNKAFLDPNLKCLFVPHIHVENKIPEIGSVCTIVNAEDDKLKGERSAIGGKTGGSGTDSQPTSTLYLQLSKRESEMRETDQVETTLQSGKALPSSNYVVSGPAITETKHSGRQLCCLCQKWANYKHLGDLYGPYYPAEYAAKLPKNQPQVRQCHTTTGAAKAVPSLQSGSNVLDALQNVQKHVPLSRPTAISNCTVSLDSNIKSLSATVRAPSLACREDLIGESSTIASSYTASKTTSLSWDMNLDVRPIPELKREADFDTEQQQLLTQQQEQPADEAQQRPQHRKLTSHPRFKRRHKSSEDSPRMVPSNSKASLPFQPPPPALDTLGPLAQLAQLPQMPMDPEELWVHEGCIVWTSGVYLVNGRLYGLQEALDGARDTSCSYCEMVGSTLGCYSKGCIRRYHYLCAIETDCSLNEDNLSLRCPKHKVTQSVRPTKSVYLEQSERG